jgi:signal transduction histidine kinase
MLIAHLRSGWLDSLHWRLRLLFCGLLAGVLVTFLWAAHELVEATLVRAAGDRAQVAADQVASLLDGRQITNQLRRLGDDPALRRFLHARTDQNREAALARLNGLAVSALRRIELWDAAGVRLLEIAGGPERGDGRKVLPAGSPPFVPGIRPLERWSDIVLSDIVADIRDTPPGTPTLGYVLIRTTFTENPPGIFNRLVGRDAAVRIGNRNGSVWSNLSSVAPAAPVDLGRAGVAQYRNETGQWRLGAVSHVRETPWATWVEFPLADIVAPARQFLTQMIGVAIAFLAIGAVVVSILTARITKPLSELTAAAESIANGDYSRRVGANRRDEIGRLGRTFNAMADQVQEAQQRLEARVAERTSRLEAANRELEAFSYSVSHDLRAPLRSIDGFSQALAEDLADKLDGKHKDYLQRVRAAARRMADLIDDLLELSRVGRAEINRHTVSLSDIARTVARELGKANPGRQVDVEIQDGLVANADRRLIQIVLENLLGNAWKFTSNVAAPRIQLGAERADGQTVYFVRDNGAGFDMTYAHKLFRPFQRLHTEADFPGTGIGLATIARIIDRHGGRVWAEGAVGAGATVYFVLPSDDPEARV